LVKDTQTGRWGLSVSLKVAIPKLAATIRSPLLLAAIAVLMAACQHGPLKSNKEIVTPKGPVRILVMPADVTLYEMTTGGLSEPQAAWTKRGKVNVDRALKKVMADNKSKAVFYREPNPDDPNATRQIQVIALQDAVARTILQANYSRRNLGLKEELDYSLGKHAQALVPRGGADYAVFVTLKDSFSSAGRQAAKFMAALIGVRMQNAIQAGLASLVDLRTGEVIWFNVYAKGIGDLREPSGAIDAVKTLLAEFPLWPNTQDEF